MAGAVGERLLDDPVGRDIHIGRQLPLRAALLDVDGQARGGRAVGQVIEPAQAWARRPRGTCPVLPQHPEHRPQLGEGLLAHLVDRGQGDSGPFRLPVDQVQRRVGLHVDDRNVVCHHVVQVPGDAQPLLARLPPRLIGPAVGDRRGALAAQAQQFRRAEQDHKTGGREHRGQR